MHSLADWKCDSKGKSVQAPREAKRFYLPSEFHFYSAGHDPSCKLGTHRQCLMLITLLSPARAARTTTLRYPGARFKAELSHLLPPLYRHPSHFRCESDRRECRHRLLRACASRAVSLSPLHPAPSACARKSHRNS